MSQFCQSPPGSVYCAGGCWSLVSTLLKEGDPRLMPQFAVPNRRELAQASTVLGDPLRPVVCSANNSGGICRCSCQLVLYTLEHDGIEAGDKLVRPEYGSQIAAPPPPHGFAENRVPDLGSCIAVRDDNGAGVGRIPVRMGKIPRAPFLYPGYQAFPQLLFVFWKILSIQFKKDRG